jgi:hypothetical protein
MYIPLSSSTPIFIGGLLRWLSDRWRGRSASEAETETSPGVLLSSGYIAGGTLAGLVIAFFVFLPESFNKALDFSRLFGEHYDPETSTDAKCFALAAFGVLAAILLYIGSRPSSMIEETSPEQPESQ